MEDLNQTPGIETAGSSPNGDASANGSGTAAHANGNGHAVGGFSVNGKGDGEPREPRAQGAGMSVTRVAIRRPLFMLMAICAVLIFGVIGYTKMGVDLYPSVNFPIVAISVVYPGAGPEAVESLVTKPIEDAVAGLANLDTISSYSSEGQSTITVQFKDKADAQTAAIDVEKRVNATRAQLPADILPPTVVKFDFNQQPIMTLALSGQRTSEQLFRIADEKIRPKLEALDGVGQVSIAGGRQREIQVKVDPARLRAYNLTLQQVSQALAAENVNAPGGQIQEPTRNFDLRVDAKFRSTDEIGKTVVSALPGGAVVTVQDVATVVDGFKDQAVLARVNGQPAVGFTVTKQATANVTNTAKLVRAEIQALQPTLPEDTHLTVVTDASVFITNSLNGVQHTLIEAILLTGLVLLCFLHSWRSTAIVVLAIPTSLVATFGMMWIQGFTLNFLTTLALTLTVGILVDDSIVVLENIYRHLAKGEAPRTAAINGRSEIGLAAIAITLVDVVVFTPVGLMSGQVGQFFRQFGFTVVAATLFSLVVSFTLTPMLASRWLRREDEAGTGWLAAFGRRWERGFTALERRYGVALRWALFHRWWVIGGAALAFALGVALPAVGIVKTEFFPDQDQGAFSVLLEMPPGTNLETTQQVASQIEGKVLQIPEVETAFTSVGQGQGLNQARSRFADIEVELKNKHLRTRTAEQVANQVGSFGNGVPGLKLRATQASTGSGTAQPIQVRIYGDDLATLNALTATITERWKALGTLKDITNSGAPGAPEYVISINRQKAADLGLSAAQVAATVRTAYAGTVATQLRRDDAVGASSGIDIRVQLTDDTRQNLDRLNAVPLLSPTKGGQVLLGQIATIGPAQGPNQIQRQDRQRVITLSASLVEGQVLGPVSNQITADLKQTGFPAGYTYKIGGTTDTQNSTFKEFGQALGLSVLLTYMLLVALYESMLYPLVVLCALPLALVGAMLGLAISRETLNLFSLIGVIMLTGLVGKNSILVVDYTNTLRRQGMSRLDALLHAGPTRLRPILMTSSALIFAQIPLVLKLEEGAEVQVPLAVVVMGGMITSTILALIFVPAMYTIVDDLQNLIGRLFHRAPRHDDQMNDEHTNDEHKEGDMNGERRDGVAAAKKGQPAVVGAVAVATLLVAGALVLSACGAAPVKVAAAPPVSVAVSQVRTDTIRASYSASGAVEAADQVPVLPKVSGRVTRLRVDVGQRVAAGDLLAELDHATLDAQVAQAAANVTAAMAKLSQLERGARTEDVAAAAAQRDAAAQQALAAVAQATAAAQGLTTLDAQVQAAQQQAAAAAAQVVTAQVRLEQLKNPRLEDLAMLQSAVNVAKVRLAQSQSRDEEIKIATDQVEQAKVSLKQAQDGARPEQVRAAQAAVDQAETALTQITTNPVRGEDVEVARLSLEGAEAAWRSAQDMVGDAQKAYNSAKQQSDNLPFLMTRAQADAQLAQAEQNLHNSQSLVEQRRVQRDQARAQYDKIQAGATTYDVRQAQERLEAAKAQLDQLKTADPDRVHSAQLALDQAQQGLDQHRKQIGFDLQSAQEGVDTAQAQLSKVQNASEYDVQNLQQAIAAAQAQAQAAQAQADALVSQRLGADSTTAAAGNQAAAAQAQAQAAQAAYALRSNPYTPEDLQTARAAVQQAQAALDVVQSQLAEAFVYAPVDGTVSTKGTAVGALVGPQAPILTLVSDAVEITLPVVEAQVASVQAGQPVTLTAAAYPGEKFAGTVTSIAPAGDPRSRSFMARVKPTDPAGKLKPGMYVDAAIATAEHAAVPVVPREAVVQKDGKSNVFVVGSDNKVAAQPVQVGLTADRFAEIVSGVKAGDRVVVLGLDDLRDGQLVTPAVAAP